jgi:hypothetical protein
MRMMGNIDIGDVGNKILVGKPGSEEKACETLE